MRNFTTKVIRFKIVSLCLLLVGCKCPSPAGKDTIKPPCKWVGPSMDISLGFGSITVSMWGGSKKDRPQKQVNIPDLNIPEIFWGIPINSR